ncbi:MAG: hypothetical protein ACXWBP_11215 [Limisphaerales bacterium]
MSDKKRIEANVRPVDPLYFQVARDIATDPTSTFKEKMLARGLEEVGQILNLLLLNLEYGLVSISDLPPDENKQFARRVPGDS